MTIFIVIFFILCWVLGVISWVIAVVEYFAVKSLTGNLFNLGIITYNRTKTYPELDLKNELHKQYTLKSTILYFAEHNKGYFGPNIKKFQYAKWGKAVFPVKGVLSFEGNTATLTIRHPTGQIIFITAWMAGWISMATLVHEKHPILLVVSLLAGIIIGGAFLSFLIRFGRKSARDAATEIILFLDSKLSLYERMDLLDFDTTIDAAINDLHQNSNFT